MAYRRVVSRHWFRRTARRKATQVEEELVARGYSLSQARHVVAVEPSSRGPFRWYVVQYVTES